MFKKRVFTLILVILVVPVFIFSAECGSDQKNNENDTFIIQGIGYPPIKAQSVAQARLMAKRAAIIDAYRNALAAAGTKNYDESQFYSELHGFVKGMTILDEEYLKDGGVRIRAQVPVKNITVLSGTISKTSDKTESGPERVKLDEWYEIIKKFVRIKQ